MTTKQKKLNIASPAQVDTNNLFPIFLKLEELNVLLVGGGHIGLEKLSAILSNAPGTNVRVIARDISEAVSGFAGKHSNIELISKEYDTSDLDWAGVVITAIDDPEVSARISSEARQRGKLVNAADKPELCDFYLGSVVKKGNLKIAISTNGKSPTIAKRLKDVLSEVMPDQIDDVLENMHIIRNRLSGNFTDKVNRLNHITRDLTLNGNIDTRSNEKRWK